VHLALAWALHQPGIDTVLVGGRSPAHLDQAFDALDFAELELLVELES
jgi:aryl-alcohol dehydrogenase-like predicted oxidoreductase